MKLTLSRNQILIIQIATIFDQLYGNLYGFDGHNLGNFHLFSMKSKHYHWKNNE